MSYNASAKKGVLLVNLGSPESPSVEHVRAYLKQFLNDPYVISIPTPFRQIFVNGIVLRNRPKNSAEAYEKIWTKNGSPLVFHTRNLTEKVRSALAIPVEFGMRYGKPSIESAIQKLLEQGVDEITFLPLYPQYSYAASETAIVLFEKFMKKKAPTVKYRIIEDFFNHPSFISALANSMKKTLEEMKPDLLLLSYHGIPESQLTRTRNRKNYQTQCLQTTDALQSALGFPKDKVQSTFQSRLGPVQWIKPYTDFVLKDLPQKGITRIAVASPSFTADCLETLEEIELRYDELFKQSGGTEFKYIPCLNSSDEFVRAVRDIIDG